VVVEEVLTATLIRLTALVFDVFFRRHPITGVSEWSVTDSHTLACGGGISWVRFAAFARRLSYRFVKRSRSPLHSMHTDTQLWTRTLRCMVK
jgi:hypothetical protein